MSRPASIDRPLFTSLTLACLTVAWWGCTASPPASTTQSSSTGSSTSTTSGTGGAGGNDPHFDGGGGGVEDSGTCVSTSAASHRIPLDIVFLIDRSGSMTGAKWQGVTAALNGFFNDPASIGIGAGMVFFPSLKASSCVSDSYEILDVPIDTLTQNAFNLGNAFPYDAQGNGTPTYVALKGALQAATAHQAANPDHKVALVMATDGDPFGCGIATIPQIADLAKSARNFDGVLTYVIGCAGATISNLDVIAAAGGTTKSYDVTQDIGLFTAKMAEIRTSAVGCDFAIPPPPGGKQLDPDKVNFSYTPKGMGSPKILPRADDLADCNGGAGWYYNSTGTKIVLCPASCATVESDANAKVDVLFGCKSLIN
jgi:uncharacterized protein YegL